MIQQLRFTLLLSGLFFCLQQPIFAQTCPESWAGCMTDAAETFIATLTPEQRAEAILPYEADERTAWSNLPFGQTNRLGIKLDKLNINQKIALHQLLQTGLSTAGYLQAMFIMQADDATKAALADMDVHDERHYGSDYYFISFYGEPRQTKSWSWRFEGHHLSLNYHIDQQEVHVSPFFAGINPDVLLKSHLAGMEIMAPETNNAFDLWHSLTPVQQKVARFQNESMLDVQVQHGDEPFLEAPVGLPLTNLEASQEQFARVLLLSFLRKLPEAKANALIEAHDLGEYYLAWAGGNAENELVYYRLQGPDVVIEYSNRDGSAHHIHSIWWVRQEAMR